MALGVAGGGVVSRSVWVMRGYPPGYPNGVCVDGHPEGYDTRAAWLDDVEEWAGAYPGGQAEPERVLAWLCDAPEWGAVTVAGVAFERFGAGWRAFGSDTMRRVEWVAEAHAPSDRGGPVVEPHDPSDPDGRVGLARPTRIAIATGTLTDEGVYSRVAMSGGWSGD